MSATYDPHGLEAAIQQRWNEAKSFETGESASGEKFYCLAMFPYPSGQLHMGHVRCYTLGDVINRYHRLKGYNVMQPMGWDAFGLPAENAAIKNGIPPASWTRDNIDYMRGQMQALGFGIDWSREFATCDPGYYHWEQWFFIKLYEKGLVYRKSSVVNWDPVDQTVLANEQVVDGRGWRSGAPVERREMDQWFLKITDYAEELLEELDALDGWPESVKSMQRNWIGRSEGVDIDFPIPDAEGAAAEADAAAAGAALTVYTTRPDTLLGATYVAVAAEHPLARRAAERSPEVAAFVEKCRNMKTAEADIATLEKEGVPTGLTVTHPLTGEALPVWVANFVLMEYGSGAVMSVPGHDQRDWEFARKYRIPIKQVIAPAPGSHAECDLEREAFVEYGQLVNSGVYDGMSSADAFDAIATALEEKGLGRRRVNFRLRDWGISRQRYWGCPIPMIHCADCGIVPVPEQDLPVILPTEVKFEGVRSPLTTMESFYKVDCPQCGGQARRETDTFDTFMESSWYYARFASPDANKPMVDDRVNYWTPVDHYVGGIEHAILHLLYARFFHKLMRDEGLVDSDEPFKRLLMLGMVLKDGRKMSKSSGDAGNPQALLDKYGADAVRTAMMFAAPPEQSFEWSEAGVEGQGRFCKRLWNIVQEHLAAGAVPDLDPADLTDAGQALRRKTHETLKRADDDYGRRLTFNTVVSAVHELTNAVSKLEPGNDQDRAAVREALKVAVLVLSPIAPHVTQALWEALGEGELLVDCRWPEVDESALVQDSVELVVQVNGKVRGKVTVARDADEDTLRDEALGNENVARFVEGKTVRKVITVPGKLVNVVVG
ncbi:MAG: leucine--tRNA ligase [Gammaproteobacteria bacterium]|jgi:leucyl-tRNA synthetase|nr:leucine--tRNA ligase [Gammaproteobacteria bacterium]